MHRRVVNWIDLMAVTVANPRPVGAQGNAFSSIGVGLFIIYVFLFFSRIPENFPSLHATMILEIALLAIALLSNSLFSAVINRVGIPLLALSACLALSIPFSVWRGGSASSYVDWLKAFAVFLITAGFLTTVRHCRLAIYAAAAGILWVAFSGLALGGFMGRMSLDIGRYGDANDFAQIMLVGLAFLCFITSAPDRSILGKIIPLGCVILEFLAFARTGSRGGLIGLILTSVILFVYSSLLARLKLICFFSAAIALGVAFLPHGTLLRYRSIFTQENTFESEQEYKDMEAATGSRAGRTYLLKTSILFTFRHPLTGVGLGMFAVAENDKARASGRANGSWHETHNMYTQVSSECGIPALIFFLMAIIRSMRDVGAIRKGRHPDTETPPTPEQRHMAFWSSIAAWGVITSGLFLSVAFSPELQFLLGLLAAFGRSVHQENTLPPAVLADASAGTAIPVPSPVRAGAFYAIPRTGY